MGTRTLRGQDFVLVAAELSKRLPSGTETNDVAFKGRGRTWQTHEVSKIPNPPPPLSVWLCRGGGSVFSVTRQAQLGRVLLVVLLQQSDRDKVWDPIARASWLSTSVGQVRSANCTHCCNGAAVLSKVR